MVHPTTGAEYCEYGQEAQLRGDGSVECVAITSATADELFACGTGYELYECPNAEACLGGSFAPHPLSTSANAGPTQEARRLRLDGDGSGIGNSTCRTGHTGVLCAECQEHFVLDRSLLCQPCPENNLLLYVVVVGLLGLAWALFTYVDGGCSDGYGAKKEPLATRLRARWQKSRTGRWCAKRCPCLKPGNKKVKVSVLKRRPPFRTLLRTFALGIVEQPDKVMMLVSFSQVVSGFSSTYNLAWPEMMVNAMRVGLRRHKQRCVGSHNCLTCSTAMWFLIRLGVP